MPLVVKLLVGLLVLRRKKRHGDGISVGMQLQVRRNHLFSAVQLSQYICKLSVQWRPTRILLDLSISGVAFPFLFVSLLAYLVILYHKLLTSRRVNGTTSLFTFFQLLKLLDTFLDVTLLFQRLFSDSE